MKHFTSPCTLPNDILLEVNRITRLYLILYCSGEVVSFRIGTKSKDEELGEEARSLQIMEDDELKFMKRFSHFSRTNLNGTVNFLATFEKKKNEWEGTMEDEEQIKSIITNVNRCINEITHQTSDLVEFYQCRRGETFDTPHSDLDPKNGRSTNEICSVEDVTKYVVFLQKKLRLEKNETKNKNVSVKLNVSDEVPPFVFLESFLLSRVLNNLISNSIKYTKRGTVNIYVEREEPEPDTLRSWRKGHPTMGEAHDFFILRIRIVDTGLGIKKKLLDRLFEPFVKNDLYSTESFSIGLVITKSLVERKLGGKLDVVSEGVEGKGTSATVTIPVFVPTEKEIHDFWKRKEDMDERLLKLGDLKSVLVVEDNVINRKVFEKQIEIILNPKKSGINAYEAENGQQALEILSKIEHENPIVLCDIDMPVMDGFGFIKQCRERYGNRIAVYSVTATIVNRSKFIRAGFDGVEQKPIVVSKLREVISELIVMREERTKQKANELAAPVLSISHEDTTKNEGVRMLFHSKIKGESNDTAYKDTDTCMDRVLGISEIETFGEEVVTRPEKEMSRRLMVMDFLYSFSTLVIAIIMYPFFPEDQQRGWGLHVLSYALVLVQYPVYFLVRWSVQTNSILSSFRLLISLLIVNTMVECTMSSESVHLAESVFAILSILTIEDLFPAFVMFIMHTVQNIYFEISRDNSLFEEADFGAKFLSIVAFYYFILFILSVVNFFAYSTRNKKKKWEEIIKEKKGIEQEFSLMMSKVSHDLATPVSGITCHLEMLKEMLHLSFDEKPTMKYLMQSSISLDYSVHNFLMACKIRNKMLKPIMNTKLRIQDFLKQMVKKLVFLKDIGTKLEVSFKSYDDMCDKMEDNLFVMVDFNAVRLVFLNLLCNTFVHSKAKNIVINLGFAGSDNMVMLTIEDDGVGISRSVIEEVGREENEVEAFRFKERFPTSLGLGLTVCTVLSEKLGGGLYINTYDPEDGEERIEYKDPPKSFLAGKKKKKKKNGTSVYFKFPCKIIEQPKEEEEEEEEEEEGEEDEEEQQHEKMKRVKERPRKLYSVESARVLCIDDCALFSNYLDFFLKRRLGFKDVVVTNSEHEAIDLMKKKKFDILISDFNLEEMDTFQMMRIVKENEGFIPTRYVVISGASEVEVTERGKEFSVDAVVSKPVSPSSIEVCLSNFCKLN